LRTLVGLSNRRKHSSQQFERDSLQIKSKRPVNTV
jgi:hypothetical protein